MRTELHESVLLIAREFMATPRLYSVVNEFEVLGRQLADFGARDTEPRGKFVDLMVSAMNGNTWVDPRPEEWQLYSTFPGWKQAAAKLTAKARQLAKIVRSAPTKDKKALAEYMGWWDYKYYKQDIDSDVM